ncbi:DUF4349 domain-containing protein [Alteribacter keqinensis]|uniref:DUF4349 domain-containing protein n=1 Tax=Alteribacter keqinensis TaxID=2483800 RepID=A0A3M7TSM4_9BACI|nr:DUF4349 domain-containing protein [Alteribacter keqinensis]RNA68443.1 DUF4349 domain-containing protein [Alteribacter keqinensis]
MNRKMVLLLGALLLLFTACSNRTQDERMDSYTESDMAAQDDSAGFSGEAGYDGAEEMDMEEMETAQNSESSQMIIYNGDLSIEVSNFDTAQAAIQEEAESLGGFVVQSSVHQRRTTDDRSGNMTIRIPQEHFFPFMNNIESSSTRVLEKTSNGNDVTEEFVDLESRLRSQEILEERLLSFLDGAENTEDLLEISRDLSEVQAEIEHLQGRINYLENHVALSTVYIHIQERAVPSIQDRETLNTFERAQSLFMDTVNVIISIFSGLIVFLIGLSPVIVPLVIGAGAIYLFIIKKSSDTSA